MFSLARQPKDLKILCACTERYRFHFTGLQQNIQLATQSLYDVNAFKIYTRRYEIVCHTVLSFTL
jgi:hypothetical protein